MKPVIFMGRSREELSAYPKPVKLRAGQELFMVQVGRDPDDWRAMSVVGPGTREIRVHDESGAFRLIYVARFRSAIYVLHAFQKKTRRTARKDIELATRRYKEAVAMEKGA